jgi:hypothetical protein
VLLHASVGLFLWEDKMAWYRLRVDWTYSTTASANTAVTNINNVLAAQGRPETVTRVNNDIDIIIEPLDEAAAISLRNALTTAWATGTRTAGKASVVRRDESST